MPLAMAFLVCLHAFLGGTARAQAAPETVIFPVLDSRQMLSGEPGRDIPIDGSAGYAVSAGGAPDYSPRSFLLYFDGERAGDMECADNLCSGSVRVPDAAVPGSHVRQRGNEYVINYANAINELVWQYWSVDEDGVPTSLRETARRQNIDGTSQQLIASAQSGIAMLPFTPTGQVIVDVNGSRPGRNVVLSTYEHRRTATPTVAYNRPSLIANNLQDQLPDAPGVEVPGPVNLAFTDASPNMAVTDGVAESILKGGGLLYDSNAYPDSKPAAGTGSLTKAMTAHLAVRASLAGLLSLDECVTLGGGGPLSTDETLFPSEFGGNNSASSYTAASGRVNKLVPQFPNIPNSPLIAVSLAPGDRISLRTLLHQSMMISDSFAIRSVARFVAQRMVDDQFADNDPAKPNTFAELVGASFSGGYFVQEMQKRAQELGLSNTTRFCDPAGRCHSTPQDVITFWQAAADDPDFVEVTSKTVFTTADQAAERASCGTRISTSNFSKSLGAINYPGFGGAKDGSAPNNLEVDYVGFALQCYQQPRKPDRACINCLAGTATRLQRPLFYAQTRVPNSPGPNTGLLAETNAFSLLNFGFRKIFTPDHLADSAAQGSTVGDFALAGLGSGSAVSSSVVNGGKLEVCHWSTFDSVQKGQCSTRSYANMLNGAAQPIAPVDIADVSTPKADGEFLTGYRESGQLKLDLWRVGALPE